MTQPTFPIAFASYWGTGPDKDDTATELSFQTPEAFNAFMTGVNNADGWLGATFVSHANFRVNKDGEIVENKQRSTPTDCQRFVVWGDSPESGSRAEKFQFDTPEQAQAFQEGVEHMVGWSKYFFVPSADFKPFDELSQAQAALPAEGAQALARYLADNDDEGIDGPYFVRADGAFVAEHWSPGEPVTNAPLNGQEWNERFDAALKQSFGVTVEDVGLDEADLARWRQGYERDPDQAVELFADKQALDRVSKPSAGFGR